MLWIWARMARTQHHLRWLARAGLLKEILPYMQRHKGCVIVVKYGGAALKEDALANHFASDIALLHQVGIRPIIVHGGGPQVTAFLERLTIDSHKIDGLRATSSEAMPVVEMVLSGQINRTVVTAINQAGGQAVGLSGRDGNLALARPLRKTAQGRAIDLGFVGEIDSVETGFLQHLVQAGYIPVLAPLAPDAAGRVYNVNADEMAKAVSCAMKADRLVVLTDVEGVLDKDSKILAELSLHDCQSLINSGIVSGGMLPKLHTCMAAVAAGTGGAVILDGRVQHSLLLELFTDLGAGTLIHA